MSRSCAKGAAHMISSTKGTKAAAKVLPRILGRAGALKLKITKDCDFVVGRVL